MAKTMAHESQNDVDAEDKNRPKRHVLKLLKLVLRFLVVALKWPVRLLNCSLEKLGKCGYDGLEPLRKRIPPYLPDGQTFFARAVVEIAGTVSAGAGVVFLASVAGAAYNQTQARWLFVTFFAIELFLAFCMAMLPEEIESESTENVKKGARLTWAGLAIITILLDLLLFIPQFHTLVTRSIFPTRSTIVISATWVRGISLAVMVLGYLFTRYIAKVVEPLVRFKSDGKPQSDNDLAVNQRHKLSGSC
jgi:phosphatidylglycerophosphate synthase